MGSAKVVSTPGAREEGTSNEDHQMPLNERDAAMYRAIVARCNYFVPDRPDMAYAVKELARSMATPCNGDIAKMKRFGRYIKGKPRLVQWFEWQLAIDTITTHSDADWAGCKAIRKSTTGVSITIGKHTIKRWNKIKFLIAFSSGGSELYASLKVAAETLGLFSMAKGFGWVLRGEAYGDASAALGIIHRRGLGKHAIYKPGCSGYNRRPPSKSLYLAKCWPSRILPTYL